MRSIGLHALLALCLLVLPENSVYGQCSGNCSYWPDPGTIKVSGLEETGPSGYPLLKIDQDGQVVGDAVIEFLNKKLPKCTLDPEDTSTIYGGGTGCGFDESELGDGLSFSWSAELGSADSPGIITGGAMDSTNYISTYGESIRLRSNQAGVFRTSGVYKVIRSFESRECRFDRDCPSRETSVRIEVERVFTTASNAKICFSLPADLEASELAAANQKYMAETVGIDGCGAHGGLSGEYRYPPTPELVLCGASSPLPNSIAIYGTNEYCNLQDYYFEKLGSTDDDWVTISETEELTGLDSLIPAAGESVLIRRQDLRNDQWSPTNTLTITTISKPTVRITPEVQSLCILAPATPLTLVEPVVSPYPVTYQWQVLDDGSFRNVGGATSSSFTSTAGNGGTYRLRVRLDDEDPNSACGRDLFSDEVSVIRNDDATVYARDADGDGFPATDATGEIRILCESIEGWVYAGLRIDCDDTDPAVHPENLWYVDNDGDGVPNLDRSELSCTAPTPTSIRAVDVGNLGDDCNDNDAEASVETDWYRDLDGDGYGEFPAVAFCSDPGDEYKRLSELVDSTPDCDDNDASWNPGTVWYRDGDLDGYGNQSDTLTGCTAPEGYFRAEDLALTTDCNDSAALYGVRERYYVDADGDGYPAANADGGVRSRLRCGPNANFPVAASELISVELADCDDTDSDVHPGVLWYPDRDGDGLGDSYTEFGRGFAACEQPALEAVRNRRDCDDYDGEIGECPVFERSDLALSLNETSLASEMTRRLGNFGTEDFTLELWLQTENEERQYLFSKGLHPQESNRWALALARGRPEFTIETVQGETMEVTADVNVADGRWHHLVIRRTGLRYSVFIDGREETTEILDSAVELGDDFERLSVSSGDLQRYVGLVDEVRFWSVARTTREIELALHGTLSGDEEGLEAYWQFEEAIEAQFPEDLVVTVIPDAMDGFHLAFLDAELVPSTAPIGPATSEFAELVPGVTEDELTFGDVPLEIDNAQIDGEQASVVATEIAELPTGAEGLPGVAATEAYYVLSMLDVGAQEVVGDLLADVGPPSTPGPKGAALTTEFRLYSRDRLGQDDWQAIASTRTNLDGTVAFRGMRLVTAQYFITAQEVTVEGPLFRRGDADGGGSVDLTDAVRTLVYLFSGGATPPCLDAADTNNSGQVDIADAVSLLNYLFIGGPPPASPGPMTCGADPAGASLGCEEYTGC